MSKADLHIHTTASDGKATPREILHLADEHELDLISITDHDTILGARDAAGMADEFAVDLLSGMEITADFEGRESHLLAYGFDMDHSAIQELCFRHKKARTERGKWILNQLSKEGLDLDIEEVKAEANWGNIGRPHIAAVLVRKGYVASSREAFIRFLSDKALGPIENSYYSHTRVIDRVREAGGVVIVAHPGNLYSLAELKKLMEAGVDGLEVIHPSHSWEIQQELERFAEDNGLLISGGSDFHGSTERYLKYFGVVTVSRSSAGRIEDMSQQRKGISVS